jgi:hypothetical protein
MFAEPTRIDMFIRDLNPYTLTVDTTPTATNRLIVLMDPTMDMNHTTDSNRH